MINISNLVHIMMAMSLLALCSGCAAVSAKAGDTMMVSVKSVNYSGDVIVFSVDDPLQPKNATGGDRASSYSGSGVQCCIQLPKKWHPGIQLVIDAIVYPVDETDFKREIPRHLKKFTVDVPQYPADQPTELWVIRTPNGNMSIVASNVDPTHEAWPGAIKGWPEPSIAVKRRFWEERVSETKDAIERTKSSLNGESSTPKDLKSAWDIRKKYEPQDIVQFNGPDDPAFGAFLTKQHAVTLKHLEAKLLKLMATRP